MYNIRKYNSETDYEMICIWWGIHDEPIPPPELMTEYTYILENKEGIPWVSLSLMTFNTKWIAWSYGLVSNPDIAPEGRKEAVKQL
jgi:hypothetical protein